MYDWLGEALRDSGQVVTASRRLARELAAEVARSQVAAGERAWRTPAIQAWADWLRRLLQAAERPDGLPTRIDVHHERILWERCLRREVGDPLPNTGLLVRQARDAWRRLRQFRVPLDECVRAATGRDQKVFARAAAGYASILERESWIDEAGLPDLVRHLVRERRVQLPPRLTLAGFGRVVPQVDALLDTVRAAGSRAESAATPAAAADPQLHRFDNFESELRVAGAWARGRLQNGPDRRVAVVVADLEQETSRKARLVREGFVPGWQTGGERHRDAVNVPFGRGLGEYPACAIALTVLRWLTGALPSRDVSLLLRSPFVGGDDAGDRSRLELALRDVPARSWTPQSYVREFGGGPDAPRPDWIERIAAMGRQREAAPARQPASGWARSFADALGAAGWPGPEPLDSAGFQLVNRWRELLNEYAGIDLVSPPLGAAEALSRLRTMAGETAFQAETEQALVQLLGPREAEGMEFDAVWLGGFTAANWPPPRRPSPLLSRTLQRDRNMPGADPEESLAAAERLLASLLAAAPEVCCSYAALDGDAEQMPSGLLAGVEAVGGDPAADPGWHAAAQVGSVATVVGPRDPVPPVGDGETVSGGARVLQLQTEDPFAAFVYGRLGVGRLPAISGGLSSGFRGLLIHDALRRLYSAKPDRESIRGWAETEVRERAAAAAADAVERPARNADAVLRALLDLERERMGRLLAEVVALDRERAPFAIVAVEAEIGATIERVPLRFRIDRIDREANGGLVILDYKTGAKKRFLTREGAPADLQLVAYAAALTGTVAGLALVNVDSRAVALDGAGEALTPDPGWPDTLAAWQREVEAAARALQRGDVRLADLHDVQGSRPLALLSRVAELRHDH